MIRNTQRTWFEVWGEETAQNKILKGLTALLVTLVAIQSIALVVLSLRKPVLIAVSSEESKVLIAAPPHETILKREVERVVESYITARHNWGWNQIEKSLNEALRFVDKDFEKTFRKATEQQIKIAKEKKLSQTFYPSKPSIDLDAGTATITADRILTIDGLRAVSPMTLQVGFRLGTRSTENPEGIYVTEETLITNP